MDNKKLKEYEYCLFWFGAPVVIVLGVIRGMVFGSDWSAIGPLCVAFIIFYQGIWLSACMKSFYIRNGVTNTKETEFFSTGRSLLYSFLLYFSIAYLVPFIISRLSEISK